ncbi:glycoside hydrolase family 32 protein [Vibrio ishigakensis]|nr:glycoside hydrolase family 32 protein [Vibrio ishigakensis]
MSNQSQSVLDLVEFCGGQSNLRRVLKAEGQQFIEVVDAGLLTSQTENWVKLDVLGETQVVLPIERQLTDSELLELGTLIDENLRVLADACVQPTECEFSPSWHVAPPQGLLNDPNGFIYHNGEYHLFYQWYPYACVHKDKYWAHLTSKDLINWEWKPLGLTPSDWFDSHGVFSGHALSNGDELMLFYTGNTRIGNERIRQTTQCLAVSENGIDFKKLGPIVPELPPGVTEHIRDPKIVKRGDEWLMFLGAQTTDLKGRLAIYSSADLKQWQFKGLFGEEQGDFGYMWECPDFFELNGESFVVAGPQGIESESKHHTIPHHNGIFKSEFGQDNGIALKEFQNLDMGFDFYAPQSLETPDGRRIMSGWMGLPDEIEHPSNNWVHQLTALRELTYVDGKLIQWPISEIESLRGEKQQFELNEGEAYTGLTSKSFELNVTLEQGGELRLHNSGEQYVSIKLENGTLLLDRTHTQIQQGDTIRELPLASEKVELRILSDNSSLELFVNGGEHVMSARVFTDGQSIKLEKGKASIELYELKSATRPYI